MRSVPVAAPRYGPSCRRPIGLGTAAAILLLGGCGAEPAADTRPLVAVSVPPQAFVVERLAGDRVRIHVMVPPGANPTAYEPTLRAVRALEEARLYVAVGHPAFPFEAAWLDPLLASRPDLALIETAADDDPDDADPHVWVTPDHVDALAVRLAAALEPLLADGRDAVQQRLAALRDEIAAVDATLREEIGAAKGRRFMVLHPAWGHLAAAYGLEQIAIEHEHKAPDPRVVAELIERGRREGTPVVFVQPQFDRTAAALVAGESGARVVVLDPLARDWADNMRRVAGALAAGLY